MFEGGRSGSVNTSWGEVKRLLLQDERGDGSQIIAGDFLRDVWEIWATLWVLGRVECILLGGCLRAEFAGSSQFARGDPGLIHHSLARRDKTLMGRGGGGFRGGGRGLQVHTFSAGLNALNGLACLH